ncbi:MAG: helix-turn-helix transcriptional regulator [Flavobacteriales bacterium]
MTDHQDTVSKIGARIKWAREQRDLKQYWVAQEAGVEGSRYNRIEKGKVKRTFSDELRSIARVLGCSLDWLHNGGQYEPWLPGQAPVRKVAPHKWQGGDAQQEDMQI